VSMIKSLWDKTHLQLKKADGIGIISVENLQKDLKLSIYQKKTIYGLISKPIRK